MYVRGDVTGEDKTRIRMYRPPYNLVFEGDAMNGHRHHHDHNSYHHHHHHHHHHQQQQQQQQQQPPHHRHHRYQQHQQQYDAAAAAAAADNGQRKPLAGRDPADRARSDQRQPEKKHGPAAPRSPSPADGQRPHDQLEPANRWRRRRPKRQHPSPASLSPVLPADALLHRGAAKSKPMVVELSDEALTAALVADGYRLGSTVGHGSYSKVRVAVCSNPAAGTVQVACKVINKMREANSSYVHKFLPRELQVLCSIRHPNVVRTHRIYVTPSTVHVFMDYCEYGDLLNHLQNSRGIPLWQAHTFFKQLTEAVDYLHRNEISHRDIKCENVLLENMRHVKLTDFGFARVCADERGRRLLSQTFCGSSSYAAPEVLQGIPYDPKAYDVWALGVVLYVMLADTMPYPYSSRQQIVVNQMAKKFAKPKKMVTRETLRFISIILEPDVIKRVTVSQIKNHQWLKQNADHQTITG